jgi:hypothetical protein
MSSKCKKTFSYDRAGERISFQEAYAVKTPSLIPESRRALIYLYTKNLHAKIIQDSIAVLNMSYFLVCCSRRCS